MLMMIQNNDFLFFIKVVNYVLLLTITLFALTPVIKYQKSWGIPKIQLEILRFNSALLIIALFINAYDIWKDLGFQFLYWSIIINWSMLIGNLIILVLNRQKIHIHYDFK